MIIYFFDFDAFVFSGKGIIEGNMFKRGKHFHQSVKTASVDFSNNTFDTFVKPILTPIRNEIIHLNNMGTSIGSMVWHKEGKFRFQTFYFPESDLVEIFKSILIPFCQIVEQLATFVMIHQCELYGYPTKNIKTHITADRIIETTDYVKIHVIDKV